MTTDSAVMETYRDVEMLVHSVTHSFLRQKKISESEYEEWHGEASMAFTRAHDSFDRRRGSRFTTWLWHCIWNALSDKLRREAGHWNCVCLSERMSDSMTTKEEHEHFETGLRFDLCSLSQDAKAVVEIVLGTFGQTDEKEAKPEEIRLTIYELLSNMGWSARRIVESFHEIRVALTE